MILQIYDPYFYDLQAPTPAGPMSIVEDVLYYALILFILLVVVFFVIGLFVFEREVVSRWNVLIPNFNHSSQDFYDALIQELDAHEVNGLKRVVYPRITRGAFSRKRNYLIVKYDDFLIEICAAPFGKSFFVSYWVLNEDNRFEIALGRIPWLGKRLVKWFYPVTAYRIDTIEMYRILIHNLVIEKIDAMLESEKLEKLSENQKIPVLKDIFAR